MKSVSLGRGNRILAMDEEIDFFKRGKHVGTNENKFVAKLCFVDYFTPGLDPKKKKKTCNAFMKVMNNIDQTIYKLSVCAF